MCNTPIFTPFALNVHDAYIVINHGAELKEKSHHRFGCFMFQQLKLLPMVYHAIFHILILASCNYAF